MAIFDRVVMPKDSKLSFNYPPPLPPPPLPQELSKVVNIIKLSCSGEISNCQETRIAMLKTAKDILERYIESKDHPGQDSGNEKFEI